MRYTLNTLSSIIMASMSAQHRQPLSCLSLYSCPDPDCSSLTTSLARRLRPVSLLTQSLENRQATRSLP